MTVAGFGFRKGASLEALQDALSRAGGAAGVTVLATSEEKLTALSPLGVHLGLPTIGLPRAVLAAQITLTHSARVKALTGTGSLAEAAALAAAGPGARLLARRAQSSDGTATAALAESVHP